jgi:hypothetical protein
MAIYGAHADPVHRRLVVTYLSPRTHMSPWSLFPPFLPAPSRDGELPGEWQCWTSFLASGLRPQAFWARHVQLATSLALACTLVLLDDGRRSTVWARLGVNVAAVGSLLAVVVSAGGYLW